MATGRRSDPILKPYQRQEQIRGNLSPVARPVYQKDYIGQALGKVAELTDTIYREMEKDNYDKYERDLARAKDSMFLTISQSNNPNDWGNAYNGFIKYAEDHGKELLGERLYNKWLDDPEHGYGFKERTSLDYNIKTLPKLMENARQLRINNIQDEMATAFLEKDPKMAQARTTKALERLNDPVLFSAADIDKNRKELPSAAAKSAAGSMLEDNPDRALAFIESDAFKNAVKDPAEIEQYRNIAQKAMYDKQFNMDFLNVATKGSTASDYFLKIVDGSLRDPNIIKASSLPEQVKNILYDCMKLHPKEKDGDGNRKDKLEALNEINFRFNALFTKSDDAENISGYSFREPRNLDNEQLRQYNAGKLKQAEELSNYIMLQYLLNNISADYATNKMTAIKGAVFDNGRTLAEFGNADKESMPGVYDGGYVQLERLFNEYGIVDSLERNQYMEQFVGLINNYMSQNNISAADFARMADKDKDKVIQGAVGTVANGMVNNVPFNQAAEGIPGSILTGAKKRYVDTVLSLRGSGKFSPNLDGMKDLSLVDKENEELRKLATNSIRIEANAVAKKSNDALLSATVNEILNNREMEIGQRRVADETAAKIRGVEWERALSASKQTVAVGMLGPIGTKESKAVYEEYQKKIDEIKAEGARRMKEIEEEYK